MNQPLDFQAIFESIPGIYLVLLPDSPRFTMVAASDDRLRATMSTREELGRGLFEVFPDNPEDAEATGTDNLRSSLERVLETRAPHTMALQKYDIPRPESLGGGFEERYWSPVNAPVLGPDGEVRYIIHRVEDVTEFMLLRQERAEWSQETERMEGELYMRALQVQEANRELADKEKELTRLNRQLVRLDEVKSRFFANVSHELRTPLTLILGPVRTLLSNPDLPSAARRDLRGVERNARVLLDRVEDLLEVARLEAGKSEASFAEIDLCDFARRVVGHFSSLAMERGLDLQVEAPDSLPVQADPDKLQKILMNLLSNACKFTPRKGRILCRLQARDGEAVLEVADSGPGIPADMRDRVFERFFQVEESETRRYSGTGLGLSIAREFAEMHRGTLEADSSELGGALLRLKIPRTAPAGAPVRQSRSPSLDSPAPEGHDLPPGEEDTPAGEERPLPENDRQVPTVLVVEDSRELGDYLRRTLGNRYHTVWARDGQEGLEQTVALTPDAVITDVMMPRRSGPQMIREIRSRPALDRIPILVLTARDDESLRVELLRNGVQDFLVKPFSAEELEARLGNHVRLKRAQEDLEEAYRSLQAAQVQLVQSAKMASLGQLVAGVAHEINNPAAFVTNNLHTIQKWVGHLSPPPDSELPDDELALWEKVRTRLQSAQDGISRIRDLVKQLRTFSRLDTDGFQVMDVAEAVDSVLRFLEHRLSEGASINLRYGPLDRVECFPGLFNQVLMNLVTNALDATNGQGTIEIATGVERDHFAITVSDNGPGLAEDVEPRIFDPFFTTKPVGQGTGLGLAISYSLMEAHHGRLSAGNNPQGGAWFRAEIPLDLARRLREDGAESGG